MENLSILQINVTVAVEIGRPTAGRNRALWSAKARCNQPPVVQINASVPVEVTGCVAARVGPTRQTAHSVARIAE
jgi:hypothetical protein